jgi:hypothetical protein
MIKKPIKVNCPYRFTTCHSPTCYDDLCPLKKTDKKE